MAHILFVLQSKPYELGITDEAHDFIMASTAYGHTAEVLFEDDGIQQLLKQQMPSNKQKNTAKRITGFHFFDVEPLWVCEQSLKQQELNPTQLIDDIQLIQLEEIQQLKQRADFVICL